MLFIFVYYAVRLLSSFRKGILEAGWRKVTIGALILVIAQLPILASWVSAPGPMLVLEIIGMSLRLIGVIFLILGFRAQYEIWRTDKKKVAPEIRKGRDIER